LTTVNTELKQRLEAVSRANSDLQNLMAVTDVGTLFLDTALHINRFTHPVTALFSITATDEGRSITDFAHSLNYDDLVSDANKVLADLVPIQRKVRSRNNEWYDVRLRPYRTIEDKIDGVVMSFVDITEQQKTEERLTEAERKLHLLILSKQPICIWELDGPILEWNRGSRELYGYGRDDALGKRKEQLLGTTVPGSSIDQLKAQLRKNGFWAGVLCQKSASGHVMTVESVLQLETADGRQLVLECGYDVTGRTRQ
jgi:two-component system CheB/CheR fusion protein